MIYSIRFNDGSTYIGRSNLSLDTVVEHHKRSPINAIVTLRLLSGDPYEAAIIDSDCREELERPLNVRLPRSLPEQAFRDAARKLLRYGHLRVWRQRRIWIDDVSDSDWIAAHD